MFTLIRGRTARSVTVTSGDVEVKVASRASGLPSTTLTRQDAHDALLVAKDKAVHFIAAVEADIEATAA